MMNEVDADLHEDMQLLRVISNKFSNNVRNNIELSNMVNQISQANEGLKDDSSKLNKQLADLRNICKDQTNIIAEQHVFEKQNIILQKQNKELENALSALKENLVEVTNDNKKQLQQQINIQKEEVEQFKQKNYDIENKWRQTLEISELNNDCLRTEYENEIKKKNEEWAEKLKSTELNQHQLKQENNQHEVTITVLNKKILELEQKLKAVECEKALYGPSQGFICSSNVMNVNFNSNPTATKHNHSSSNVYFCHENLKQPTNQIKKNLNQTTKMETQHTKIFNFRKNVATVVTEKKKSSTLTAAELRRQMFNSSKNNWAQPVDSQEISLASSENESFSLNHLDQPENNNITAPAIKPDNLMKLNHSMVKKKSPNNKRKRLFDPNNFDYLDSNHF